MLLATQTKPAFRIDVAGTDISAVIADRLLGMTVTDEEGVKADTFQIELDNRDQVIAIPQTGASLKVWLGFQREELSFMGQYVVSSVSGTYGPDTLNIASEAAEMTGAIRAPRTRAWQNATLGSIIDTIAAEHALKPAIPADLRAIALPFIAQTAESNLHFLTRLAHRFGLMIKPAAGRLMAVLKGSTRNAAGVPMTAARISRQECESPSWSIDARADFKAVEAQWGNPDGGSVDLVKAGSGTPTRRLRTVYATQAEALAAARAELDYAQRESYRMTLDMAGFRPGVFAGGRARLSGFLDDHNGTWEIVKVTHTLSGSLRSSADLRKVRA